MSFDRFKIAVQRQFHIMKDKNVYRSNIDTDALYQLYLDSFPNGTNPKYKERAEYDCSACKSFIRHIGALVSVDDNYGLTSIWDITIDDPTYQTVANALAAYVKAGKISNVYLHPERVVGVDKNVQLVDNRAITWHHFFVQLPPTLYCAGKDIGTKLSDSTATHDVFYRGLTEITEDSVSTILDLIRQGSLYRGEEHKNTLEQFQKLQKEFLKLSDAQKDNFSWEKSRKTSAVIARVRNTAIGTLMTDLSEGRDLEHSVSVFERMVAPMNYRRPNALITPRMIEDAKKKVEELGLTSSLNRRYATLDDVALDNLIFTNRDSKKNRTGNAFDDLASTAGVQSKSLAKIEEISIDKFLTDVVPNVSSIEALFENRHSPNMVSLIAPEDLTAKTLFQWDNPFSWAYQGDVTDSIKERVKTAGGNVAGDVRISLSWGNYDDLDLHVKEPNGIEISYHSKVSYKTGGNLDVDMNYGAVLSKTPVENVAYPSRSRMTPGTYQVYVNQYSQREMTGVGFDLEIEIDGVVHSFSHANALRTGQTVHVASIQYANGVFKVIPVLPSSQAVKQVGGIETQTYHKVSAIMLSPNFWGSNTVGNKHFFFMLDGLKNEGKARGFFNEFLSSELNPHRKVLEVLGAKTQVDESDHQLTGLGFSSTQRNSLVVRVSGNFTRTLKINF